MNCLFIVIYHFRLILVFKYLNFIFVIKRKESMERYCTLMDLSTIYIENEIEHEAGNCSLCYEIRLAAAAQFAKNRGFDCFTTTLLVSPYQKHDLIKQIGEGISKKLDIEFLYKDFRGGYYKSRDLAKMYNLYRQKYCGCPTSIKTGGGKK